MLVVGVVDRLEGHLGEVGGNRGIVVCGMREGLLHEIETRFEGERTIASGKLIGELGVVLRVLEEWQATENTGK